MAFLAPIRKLVAHGMLGICCIGNFIVKWEGVETYSGELSIVFHSELFHSNFVSVGASMSIYWHASVNVTQSRPTFAGDVCLLLFPMNLCMERDCEHDQRNFAIIQSWWEHVSTNQYLDPLVPLVDDHALH